MEWVARFYYNETKFPGYKVKTYKGSIIIDTSFYDFIHGIKTRNYFILDPAEGNYPLPHGLEVLNLGRRDNNKDELKEIFSSVFSNDKFFPESVSCKDRRNYRLVEEVLKEKRPDKNLSDTLVEKLFNRHILD